MSEPLTPEERASINEFYLSHFPDPDIPQISVLKPEQDEPQTEEE